MSLGITPYDFVQQVYYVQEKVILDFQPDDDKYKEVLMEANLVLQELQKEEDWTWLRHQIILGPMTSYHGEIPEFELPDWVYKVSTRFCDGVQLCHHSKKHGLDTAHPYTVVPFVSTGTLHRVKDGGIMDSYGRIQYTDRPLGAVVMGNTLTFDRVPSKMAQSMIAVVDVQKRIEQFHICNSSCEKKDGVCTKIEKKCLTSIPDPNYVIIRTAALHAQGSPPAQGRIADLTDQAQKLLSAMRQNDASTTDPDIIEWDTPGWIGAI